MRLENIPMPPSSNSIYGQYVVHGVLRRVKSRGFRDWERRFAEWALINHTAIMSARYRLQRMVPGQLISIDTQFNFKRSSILTKDNKPKRNDTSNRLKVVHDAIAGAIQRDDSYFFDGTFSKRIVNDEQAPEICNVELTIVDAPWVLDH